MVKIDPKSIGVGQYQHDVSQTKLARGGIPVKPEKEEKAPEKPVPAVLALAEQDFGAAEIERQVRTLRVIRQQAGHCLRDRFDITGRHQHAGITERLRIRGDVGGHTGNPAGHRFKQHVRQPFEV